MVFINENHSGPPMVTPHIVLIISIKLTYFVLITYALYNVAINARIIDIQKGLRPKYINELPKITGVIITINQNNKYSIVN